MSIRPAPHRLVSLTPVEQALLLAQAGWLVMPRWPIIAGHCACPAASTCPHPGDHAMRRPGFDFTTNAKKIERMWSTYPTAAVAKRPPGWHRERR